MEHLSTVTGCMRGAFSRGALSEYRMGIVPGLQVRTQAKSIKHRVQGDPGRKLEKALGRVNFSV